MNTKFLFRCDGGNIPGIGTGHIIRSAALAHEINSNSENSVIFLINDSKWVYNYLTKNGFNTVILKEEDDEITATHGLLIKNEIDIVIIDKLDINQKYAKRIIDDKRILVTLDNPKLPAELSTIKINGIIDGNHTPYSGLDYIAFPIKSISPKKSLPPGKIFRLFISFGGFDYLNLLSKVINALSSLPESIDICVVANSELKSWSESETIPDYLRNNISFYYDQNPDEFNHLLSSSDFALISGGLSLFQALALGVPSIVIAQCEHQYNTASKFEKIEAVINLGYGSAVDEESIISAINVLLSDPQKRKNMSMVGKKLIDLEGLHRVSDLIRIVKPLRWDTEFFGFNIARLCPTIIDKEIVDYAFKKCLKGDVDCLYYMCDCNHSESVKLAEENGFHFVDIRYTLTQSDAEIRDILKKYEDVVFPEIREIRESDLPVLETIASNSYVDSRYFYDSHFSPKKCQEYYSTWLRKCSNGEYLSDSKHRVFVAITGYEPSGYIAVSVNQSQRGTITLTGIGEKYQGKKLGEKLIIKALEWFKSQEVHSVDVVTQGRNYRAQRLYQKCGFRTSKMQLWYHKWFNQ